jgi:hypothetical protein
MKHSCCGVFLAILLVIFFIFAISLINLKSTIFNQKFIETELQKSNFYNLVEQNAPKFVEQALSQESGSQEFVSAVKSTVTANWVKIQTETNLTSFSNWFYGKSQTLNLSISFASLKDNFFSQMQQTYNSLPVCKSSAELQVNGFSLTCRISGMSFSKFKDAINQDLSQSNNNIFGNFSYNKNPLGNAQIFSSPGITLNWLIYIFSGLSLILLLIIGLMARQSWRGFFRWIGIPLLIASFLLLCSAILSRVLAGTNYSLNSFFPAGTDYGNILINVINPLTKTINTDVANRNLLISGIIFIFSVILIIISFFFKKPEEKIIVPKT